MLGAMHAHRALGITLALLFATHVALAQEEPPAEPAPPPAEAPPAPAEPESPAKTAADSAGPAPTSEAEQPAKAPNPEDARAPGEGDDYGHGGQFGIRAGLVGGYRMVFRYDASPFCSPPDRAKQVKDQQKFCGHAGPLAVDLGLSFAPIDGVEPYVWGRFGMSGEAETNTNPIVIVGAGLRVYTMSDSKFKIFIEPAVGAELEGGAGNPEWEANDPDYKKDIVFHLAAGPQIDVAKAVGFYLSAGITTGILRSIHSSLELNGGVQLRVP